MAALIFLSGDDLVVHDNCQLMFHTYSGYFSGKGNEQQAEAAAVGKWFEKVMCRLCSPFLTETEIRNILNGSDIWLDSDDIHRRLLRVKREIVASQTKKSRRTPAKKA